MTPAEQGADPRYVAARRVLVDALVALAPHGPAVIVVGAQAVYLRAGDADLTVAPYTTDGDLAIDPGRLEDAPRLAEAMGDAGFARSVEPGIWVASATVAGEEVGIPVDLIVPEDAAPPEVGAVLVSASTAIARHGAPGDSRRRSWTTVR